VKAPPGFTEFWTGSKPQVRGIGSRAKALKAWIRDGLEPRADELAEAWDRQFYERVCKRAETGWAESMRHTVTWLNNQGWEDPPLQWDAPASDRAPDLVGIWDEINAGEE